MPIRYDLIEANDRAVRLLHEGLYARAVHAIENALQFLRRVAVETAKNNNVSAPPSEDWADPIERALQDDQQQRQQQQRYNQYHSQHVGDLRIVASSRTCRLWNARCPEGVFSFCSRPMVLTGRQDQVIRSSHNQNRAAAALMYNLSLAHQGLFGLPPKGSPPSSPSPTSPFGDRILTCSLKVCSMAVDLMSRLPASVCTDGDSVLYMSALNNQGFLHVYFSNGAEANRTMSMLERFFASRPDEDYGYSSEGDDNCVDVRVDDHRTGPRNSSDRDAYKTAVNDVVYSVLLCQGRTVLDAAPAA